MCEFPIPKSYREPLYNTYCNLYGVNKEEILNDLKDFKNFQEFFTRKIKSRDIHYSKNDILSPADSTILTVQEVDEDQKIFLKGFQYSISEVYTGVSQDSKESFNSFKKHKDSKLISVIQYLSGKDYHRFHFPFDCKVNQSIHFPGLLKTVSIEPVLQGNKAFEKNERVVVEGEYNFGNYKLAAIGANYVGSIKISFDNRISTNKFNKKNIQKYQYNDLHFKAGDELGMFLMGSSFMMLLEVPKDYKIDLKDYQVVKYGEKINKQFQI